MAIPSNDYSTDPSLDPGVITAVRQLLAALASAGRWMRKLLTASTVEVRKPEAATNS